MNPTRIQDVVNMSNYLSTEELAELIRVLQARLDIAASPQQDLSDFPVIDLGPWPEHLSLRREDMYDDEEC